MSLVSQVSSSSVAGISSPVVSESVSEEAKIVDKKVEAVALQQVLEKKELAFKAHREHVWTILSKSLTEAKEALEGLSLGWDLVAQCTRVGGLAVLGTTEAEQKTKIETASTEKELLERLKHIQNRTIPGLAKLIPAGETFEPVLKFLNQKMSPIMESLLMECHDRRI